MAAPLASSACHMEYLGTVYTEVEMKALAVLIDMTQEEQLAAIDRMIAIKSMAHDERALVNELIARLQQASAKAAAQTPGRPGQALHIAARSAAHLGSILMFLPLL
jgi:hypothetical protein